MTITHVTEREMKLANMLKFTNDVLDLVAAERDKLTAELASLRDSGVELPDHPEPHTMKWLMCELDAIKDYGDRRAMAERERCAKICDERAAKYLDRSAHNQHSHGAGLGATICAEAIRKGEKS